MSDDTGDRYSGAEAKKALDNVSKSPLQDLTYKELQIIAKSWDLPANLKLTEMRRMLSARKVGDENTVSKILSEYRKQRSHRRSYQPSLSVMEPREMKPKRRKMSSCTSKDYFYPMSQVGNPFMRSLSAPPHSSTTENIEINARRSSSTALRELEGSDITTQKLAIEATSLSREEQAEQSPLPPICTIVHNSLQESSTTPMLPCYIGNETTQYYGDTSMPQRCISRHPTWPPEKEVRGHNPLTTCQSSFDTLSHSMRISSYSNNMQELPPVGDVISQLEAHDLSMGRSEPQYFHQQRPSPPRTPMTIQHNEQTSFMTLHNEYPSFNIQYNGRHSEPPFVCQFQPSPTHPPPFNFEQHSYHSELASASQSKPFPTAPLNIQYNEHNSEPVPVSQYQLFPTSLYNIKHNEYHSEERPSSVWRYQMFSSPPLFTIQQNEHHSESPPVSLPVCQYQPFPMPSLSINNNEHHSESPTVSSSVCQYQQFPKPSLSIKNNEHHSESPTVSSSVCQYQQLPVPLLSIKHNEHHSVSPTVSLPVCQYEQLPMPLLSIKHNEHRSESPTVFQYQPIPAPSFNIEPKIHHTKVLSVCDYQPVPNPSFSTGILHTRHHSESPIVCEYQPVLTPLQFSNQLTEKRMDNNIREYKEHHVPNIAELPEQLSPQPKVGQEQFNTKKLPSALELTLNIKSEYLMASNSRPMPKIWTKATTSIYQCYTKPLCSTKLSIRNELFSTRHTADNGRHLNTQTDTERIEIQPLPSPIQPPVCTGDYLNQSPLQTSFPDFRQNNELSYPLIYNYVASTEDQLREQQESDTLSAINFDLNLEEDEDRPIAISTPNNGNYPERVDTQPTVSQVPQLSEAMLELIRNNCIKNQEQLQLQQKQKRKTRYNCLYQRLGCIREYMNVHDAQKHERECEFQTVTCYNNCTWRGLLKNLATHIRETHEKEIARGSESSHKVKVHDARLYEKMAFFCEVNRRLFILCVQCHGHLLYATVQFVPPVKAVKSHLVKASIEVIGRDGTPYSWRGKVKPLYEPLSTLWATDQCLTLDPKDLGVYAGSSIIFHTKITIYGNASRST